MRRGVRRPVTGISKREVTQASRAVKRSALLRRWSGLRGEDVGAVMSSVASPEKDVPVVNVFLDGECCPLRATHVGTLHGFPDR